MAEPLASSLVLLPLAHCFTPHLCYCCSNMLHPPQPRHSLHSHSSLCLEGSFPWRPFLTYAILACSGITFPEKPSQCTSSKMASLDLSLSSQSASFSFSFVIILIPWLGVSISIYIYIHTYLFVYCLFPLPECKLPAVLPGLRAAPGS